MNYMMEKMSELENSVKAQRDQYLRDICYSYNINMEDSLKSRFPQLIAEINADGSESWYYNNHTKDGLLLITFDKLSINTDRDINGDIKLTASYNILK